MDINEFFTRFLMALALSADAFAACLAAGISSPRSSRIKLFRLAAFCGIFQAVMPATGFLFGTLLSSFVDGFNGYVAFALLAFIGTKMVWEGIKNRHEDPLEDGGRNITLQYSLFTAVATSIDAMAVGAEVSIDGMNLFFAGLFFLGIGLITVTNSFIGASLGKYLGGRISKLKTGAEIMGGVILICIGIKSLF